MSASPDRRGLLLCTALVVGGTVTQALAWLVVLSLQLLLLCLLLTRLRVPRPAVWLFAVGCGTALLQLSTLTPFPLPLQPLTVLAVTLCGAAAPQKLPAGSLWRTAACMLLLGLVRELLSEGSFVGIALFPPPAVNLTGAGTLLLAAGGAWLWGLHPPVTVLAEVGAWPTVWLTLAVGFTKLGLEALSLPTLWVIEGAAVCAAIVSQLPGFRSPWAPLIPALSLCQSAVWHPLLAAGLAGIAIATVGTLQVRWRRRPLRKSFAGAPALLTITAVGACLFSAF